MKDILINHLELHGFIGDHQFGFRKYQSCLAQLLNFYNNILGNIEDGSNCDVIFLNFAKEDMIFNVDKLNVVSIGRKAELKKTYNYLTPGNDRIITDGSLVRDLGVMINEEGNYLDHISKVYSKILQ